MKDKFVIDQVSKSYILSKTILKEEEMGISFRNKDTINAYRLIIDRIDNVISSLDEDSKFILINEVKLGKKGEWYREFLSTPTYYRHRKAAYRAFLNCLKQ